MPSGVYDRGTPEERFWPKVNKTDSCWLWTASKSSDGYGGFRLAGKMVRAHRFAYELLVGPIPDGLELDHLCRVRECVNPKHLEAVTLQENIRRGNTGKNNGNKTHCPQGHEYTEANIYITPEGKRHCRECGRIRMRAYHAKKRAMKGIVGGN